MALDVNNLGAQFMFKLAAKVKSAGTDHRRQQKILEWLYCRLKRELHREDGKRSFEEVIFLSFLIFELDTTEPYVEPDLEVLRQIAFAYALLYSVMTDDLNESDEEERSTNEFDDGVDVLDLDELEIECNTRAFSVS